MTWSSYAQIGQLSFSVPSSWVETLHLWWHKEKDFGEEIRIIWNGKDGGFCSVDEKNLGVPSLLSVKWSYHEKVDSYDSGISPQQTATMLTSWSQTSSLQKREWMQLFKLGCLWHLTMFTQVCWLLRISITPGWRSRPEPSEKAPFTCMLRKMKNSALSWRMAVAGIYTHSPLYVVFYTVWASWSHEVFMGQNGMLQQKDKATGQDLAGHKHHHFHHMSLVRN